MSEVFPVDPQWAKDAELAPFFDWMKKYMPDAKIEDSLNLAGWAYGQTIEQVFQEHALPRGTFMHRGKRVDLGAITDTGLLAVEGERDDISGIGQTRAALTCATNLAERNKRYFLAPEVGHYGIFNGSRWRSQIAPVLEEWFAQHAQRSGRKALKAV